MVKIWKAVN